MEYNEIVSKFRDEEYPMLKGKVYLDHGGTTIYAKSLIDSFSSNLLSNLYGNPHSAFSPAKLSGQVVDSTREKALRFFGADPEYFDLVFVANATAGIKLVAEAFRDLAASQHDARGSRAAFWYGYHKDCHTSLVGVRELTNGNHHCFASNEEVETWIQGPDTAEGKNGLALFAYPAQSNMTGGHLPLMWPRDIRSSQYHQDTYTLLDAAAFASTSPLSPIFQDPLAAPDFTVLSFYKIFGFPDLGALIVKKDSGHVLAWRKYFGGGTVDMVVCLGDSWYKRKGESGGEGVDLHDMLEDGTVAFHSVVALDCAISVHEKLYGSMEKVSSHVGFLVRRLYSGMKGLFYPNGQPLCVIYGKESYEDCGTQGGTIAFNVLRSDGLYVPYSAVERMADEQGIFVRTGGLCNPGGIASHLELEPWQMKRAWSAGHRCGKGESSGTELVGGRPTGVVRVSLGAMSLVEDVDVFLSFLESSFLGQESGSSRWEDVAEL